VSEDKKLSLIERAVSRSVDPASLQRSRLDGPDDGQSGAPQEGVASVDPRATPARPEQPSQRRCELDLARLEADGFLVPADGRSQLAEEFRMIKRPLLSNAFGTGATLVADGNLIMVTSTYPSEGKTFTAINLAMSLAKEIGKTVMLVDADVGRSSFHRVLGTPSSPGLIDALLDQHLSLGDIIIETNIPNLRILPKGRSHNLANELLASSSMARITRELADRYPDRIIVFDSPPLLITNEAVALSAHMGQIVFVIEAERTVQSAVKEALGLLDADKPIGLVLNKARRPVGGDFYGHYGHYGYYGYSDRAEGATA